MAATPEGRIKKKINKVLDNRGEHLYYYMPVPGGYGRTTLDYLGGYYGWMFAIEAKSPGKKMTARQTAVAEDIVAAKVPVFVIDDGDESLAALERWLDAVAQWHASFMA